MRCSSVSGSFGGVRVGQSITTRPIRSSSDTRRASAMAMALYKHGILPFSYELMLLIPILASSPSFLCVRPARFRDFHKNPSIQFFYFPLYFHLSRADVYLRLPFSCPSETSSLPNTSPTSRFQTCSSFAFQYVRDEFFITHRPNCSPCRGI